ncbi:MAG: Polysaccharide biosynthesis protein CapD-like [Frankiales bacterium]|nr:Polysaccharide biosynthesis protein CapD-like [Frankiales bacterium]
MLVHRRTAPPTTRTWRANSPIMAQLSTDPGLVACDVALVAIAYVTALLLRFDGDAPPEYWLHLAPFVAVAVSTYVLLLAKAGLYARVWGEAGAADAWWLGVTAGIAAVGLVLLDLLPFDRRLLPVSVPVNAGLLTVLLLAFARFHVRLREQRRPPAIVDGEAILVIGAPHAARAAVERMRGEPLARLRPVVIVTDEANAWHRCLAGVPVVGPVNGLGDFAGMYGGQQVLLLPGADSESDARVLALARAAGLGVRTLPGLDATTPTTSGLALGDIAAEALLGRPPVAVDLVAVRSIVAGRRVLITGAGGSIGSEIALQVSQLGPAELVLLDHDETHLHDAMARIGGSARSVLGDIRDEHFVEQLMLTARPDIVFHAAAHKHVPILEHFPAEAVRTNVHGTDVLVRAAVRSGTQRFVAISTDKAVRPRCVMGATKRLAEQIVVQADGPSRHFCAVRFGNVLGSRGSVVPTFLEQLRTGGPLTVTHPEMTRYFMTTREAVSLVLQAAATSQGGEVFVLDMGQPVRILDLAQRLIDLVGARDGRQVEVRISGLRPGEKLTEELSSPEESVQRTSHPKVFRVETAMPDPALVREGVAQLCAQAWAGRDEATRCLLFELAGAPGQLGHARRLVALPDVEVPMARMP